MKDFDAYILYSKELDLYLVTLKDSNMNIGLWLTTKELSILQVACEEVHE